MIKYTSLKINLIHTPKHRNDKTLIRVMLITYKHHKEVKSQVLKTS